MNLQVNDEAEEALLEDEDNTDETMFENERCGICTDIVIDRGVLDCCHHWFCFMCIDNWAAITNLCPLCKKEFQLITCLPVYDTIGGLKNEEHPLSRDDDWRIQGKNNTLSFPSYYIDEDAVLCLDGDGCKIRKGTATVEQDLTFDTSIACDSCDIWYHAFCVEFNPECTSEGSWLCPRCITDAAQPKSDGAVMENPDKCSAPRSSEFGWTVDPSFSGKVSISVADDGETAVVVSMVEAEQTKATTTSLSEVGRDLDVHKEIGTSLLDNDSGNAKPDVQLKNGGCVELARNGLICSDEKWSNASTTEIENNSDIFFDIAPEMAVNSPEAEPSEKSLVLPCLEDAGSEMTISQHTDALKTTLALSTLQDVAVSCYSAAYGDLVATKTETRGCHLSNSDELKISSPLPYDTSKPKNELCGDNCPNKLNIGLSVPTFSTAGKLAHDDTASHVPADGMTQFSDRSLSDSEVGGLMGKCTNKILSNVMNAGCVKNSKKRKLDADPSVNEAKSDGKRQILPSESAVSTSVPEYSQKCSGMTAANYNESLRFSAINKASTPDIMSIVQEIDVRSENPQEGTKFEDKLERKDSSAGLRVKKIMRRVGDQKESSILVQKLRKEIKEAVQDKTLNNIVKDSDSDGRLLRAFRAAIVKPTNEPVGKFDPSIIGAKKSLLQKGKTRESLTKKIYGTSSGRRRRAWDRDWEIEFWKHRCKRVGTEKVETLQSVLELLRKATNSCSNNTEMDQESEGEATNSILSRVYPADASVFPRKDNIKPLSALTGCCPIDELKKGKSLNNLAEKEPQTVHASNMAGNPTGISKKTPEVISSDGRVRQVNNTSFTGSVSCGKENIDGRVAISESNTSGGRVQNSKEIASQSDTPKSDKRKWALEVLARKNALTNTSASKGKQEDKAALKGNYPLLAQLPTDMRPVPAPSRHNKVSVSVRQAQLYRITEYYLRKTNLPVVRRTADTELAVADAVNVEKEIFERSNSKLVYINLCSQALSQRYSNIQPAETVASLPSTAEEGGDRIVETTLDSSPKRWSNVEEALKLAGLSSDSPPNSPSRTNKDPSKEGNSEGDAREKDLENVLDVDIHPELDIYGDFEYDLENEGYISSFAMGSALGASKVSDQQKGDSRMKVVLSTARCTESDSILESKHDSLKPHSPDNKAAGSGDDNLSDKLIGIGNEPKNSSMDTPILPKLSEEETYMEPSLTECEELYGPDKEFSIRKISDELIGKLNKSMEMEAVASKELHGTKKEHVVNKTSDESNTIEMGASASDGTASFNHGGEDSPAQSRVNENVPYEGRMRSTINKSPDPASSVSKKVEAYIKAHIRPLCISRVITVEQYRWAVGKTTDKVMKFHHKAKNANFLIKEGEKVKKLAEQYVEAAQQI